jgi:hypothetical protein
VLEPVAISGGFPLRIPDHTLAVPRHGIINGHPTLLRATGADPDPRGRSATAAEDGMPVECAAGEIWVLETAPEPEQAG